MLETLRQFGSKLTAFLDTLDPLAHFLLVIGVMFIQFLVFIYITVPCAKFVGRETWRGARGISKVFGSLFNFRSKPCSPLYTLTANMICASNLTDTAPGHYGECLEYNGMYFPLSKDYYTKDYVKGISFENDDRWINHILSEAELKLLHNLVQMQWDYLIKNMQIRKAERLIAADKDPQSPTTAPPTSVSPIDQKHAVKMYSVEDLVVDNETMEQAIPLSKGGIGYQEDKDQSINTLKKIIAKRDYMISRQDNEINRLNERVLSLSAQVKEENKALQAQLKKVEALEEGNRQLLKRIADIQEQRKKRSEAEGILRNAIDVYCDVADVGTSNPANPDAFEAIKQALTDMAETLIAADIPLDPFIPRHREHYIHLLSDYALDEYFQIKRQQRV